MVTVTLTAAISKVIREAIRQTMSRVQIEGRGMIPIGQTGKLAASFDVRETSEGMELVVDTLYGEAMDTGIDPHWAYPSGEALKWTDAGGQVHFSRWPIWHPGFAGYHYMDRIKRRAVEIFRQELPNQFQGFTVSLGAGDITVSYEG